METVYNWLWKRSVPNAMRLPRSITKLLDVKANNTKIKKLTNLMNYIIYVLKTI